jgi:RNA polymerase sigma-70 factor (ECF subfamily)
MAAMMMSDPAPATSLAADTSASLLVRVKAREGEAWGRLVALYSPMVYRWARKANLQPNDAQDVVQSVFLAVASDIDQFRRRRPGDSFRGWLWTIARHKILDHFRDRQQRALAAGGSTAQHRLQQCVAPEPDEGDAKSETCRLRHRALASLRESFAKHVWEAVIRTVVHGDRPGDVARDLGVSVATVYRAKVRVLARLRTELQGL